MKLGVFAVLFSKMSLEKTLDYVKSVGVEAWRSAAAVTWATRTAKRPNCCKTRRRVRLQKAVESRG